MCIQYIYYSADTVWDCNSLTEDMEFSMKLLTQHGSRTCWGHDAIVHDDEGLRL